MVAARITPLVIPLAIPTGIPLSVVVTVAAQATDAPTLDVLRNGGAEARDTPRGNSRGQPTFALTAWEGDRRDGWLAQAGPWGDLSAVDGAAFVRAAAVSPGALWQDVAVTPQAGHDLALLLSGFTRTGRDRDRIEVAVAWLDADGRELQRKSTGERGSPDWSRFWLASALAPATAARVARARVTLTARHVQGQYLDAFADDLRLWVLGAAAPTARAGRDDPTLLETLLDQAAKTTGPQRTAALAVLLGGGINGGINGGISGRAGKLLADALARDDGDRAELLALATLTGQRDAARQLRRALEGGADDLRALALELLPLLRGGDWRKLAAELLAADDRGLRGAAARALAQEGSKDAQRALIAACSAAKDDDELPLLAALQARATPLDDVYRDVLAPRLTPSAAADARHEALRTLAAWHDPRLSKHVLELTPKEETYGRRAAWLDWCADLGTPAAAEVLVTLAAKGVARADACLLARLPTMPATAVLPWARAPGLRHPQPVVRMAAARVLGALGNAGDVDALLALARDADPEVATQSLVAAAHLARTLPGDGLARSLANAQATGAAPALRAAWRDGVPAPAVVAATQALVRADSVRVRAAAVACAGHAADAAELRARALDDPAWQVRAAAYAAFADARTRESVTAILDRLAHDESAARHAGTRVLAQLTGEDKGSDPADWQRWWQLAGSTFTLPADLPAAPERTRKTPPAANATAAVRYHGVPVDGARVAFVLDLSGSMRDPQPGRDGSKLRAAQDELLAVLRRLPETTAFALVGFANDAQVFGTGWTQAKAEPLEAARKWIERLEAKGWTNLWAGLATALALPDVDTVFVLSDGAPSLGRYVDATAVRQAAAAANFGVFARIHTIALAGDRHDRALLRHLAADSGGVFLDAP